MHVVGARDRLGRRLRESEKADLAGVDQHRHRADRLLDRDVGVDPMLVVEVDVIDAETPQRSVARGEHVFRAPVDPALGGILAVAHDPELGRQHDLVAPARDRAADEQLVVADRVHVRRVEHRHAKVERAMDRRDRLALVGRPVELGHPHAAQPFGSDEQSLDLRARVAPLR